jgi:hypothetical protein
LTVPLELVAYVCRRSDDPEALRLCRKYAGPLAPLVAGEARYVVVDGDGARLAAELGLRVAPLCGDPRRMVAHHDYTLREVVEAGLVGAALYYAAYATVYDGVRPGPLARRGMEILEERGYSWIAAYEGEGDKRCIRLGRMAAGASLSIILSAAVYDATRYLAIVDAPPAPYSQRLIVVHPARDKAAEAADDFLRAVAAGVASAGNVPTLETWYEEMRRAASRLSAYAPRGSAILVVTHSAMNTIPVDPRSLREQLREMRVATVAGDYTLAEVASVLRELVA